MKTMLRLLAAAAVILVASAQERQEHATSDYYDYDEYGDDDYALNAPTVFQSHCGLFFHTKTVTDSDGCAGTFILASCAGQCHSTTRPKSEFYPTK